MLGFAELIHAKPEQVRAARFARNSLRTLMRRGPDSAALIQVAESVSKSSARLSEFRHAGQMEVPAVLNRRIFRAAIPAAHISTISEYQSAQARLRALKSAKSNAANWLERQSLKRAMSAYLREGKDDLADAGFISLRPKSQRVG